MSNGKDSFFAQFLLLKEQNTQATKNAEGKDAESLGAWKNYGGTFQSGAKAL